MVSESVDRSERRELCDLLMELGPDCPTLCEGWSTGDLAAHLVLREHFRRSSSERIAAERAKGFSELVARVRGGTPFTPWRLPVIGGLLNGFEFFLHHEDVRRANGFEARADIPDVEAFSWRWCGYFARGQARAIRPYGLNLVRSDGASKTFGSGDTAILTGRSSELVLFLTGRRAAADVTVTGPVEAINAVSRARVKL